MRTSSFGSSPRLKGRVAAMSSQLSLGPMVEFAAQNQRLRFHLDGCLKIARRRAALVAAPATIPAPLRRASPRRRTARRPIAARRQIAGRGACPTPPARRPDRAPAADRTSRRGREYRADRRQPAGPPRPDRSISTIAFCPRRRARSGRARRVSATVSLPTSTGPSHSGLPLASFSRIRGRMQPPVARGAVEANPAPAASARPAGKSKRQLRAARARPAPSRSRASCCAAARRARCD